jgi:MYXO-CTERM domain-containing protein
MEPRLAVFRFGGKADILFATGLGALGLLGWRRKRRQGTILKEALS